MRIHHLNCGTHCPIGGAFYDGVSRRLTANICTHCLLIETEAGLVLVDTGYGLKDVQRNAPRRLARTWPFVLRPRLDEAETALRQVEARGFVAADVRHIILTHLDFDHAGGIDDFPNARVHVLADERRSANERRRGFVGLQRYRPSMWSGVGDWRTYLPQGEAWFGFEAVRELDGLPPEILMVPLAGHTDGHAGVAIRCPDGWLLHAGDAYLHHGELDARPRLPPGLAAYGWIMTSDRKAARRNLARLRELKQARNDEVAIFCSHDTTEYAMLRGRFWREEQGDAMLLGG